MSVLFWIFVITAAMVASMLVIVGLAVLLSAGMRWWDRMQTPGGAYPVREIEGPDGEKIMVRLPEDAFPLGGWVDNGDGSMSCSFRVDMDHEVTVFPEEEVSDDG